MAALGIGGSKTPRGHSMSTAEVKLAMYSNTLVPALPCLKFHSFVVFWGKWLYVEILCLF